MPEVIVLEAEGGVGDLGGEGQGVEGDGVAGGGGDRAEGRVVVGGGEGAGGVEKLGDVLDLVETICVHTLTLTLSQR